MNGSKFDPFILYTQWHGIDPVLPQYGGLTIRWVKGLFLHLRYYTVSLCRDLPAVKPSSDTIE